MMMTTLNEPGFFYQLKNDHWNADYFDSEQEVMPFLREQYEYEMNRSPRHRSFDSQYHLSYFDANAMLNYYLNPTGETNVRYEYDIYSNTPFPLIKKRVRS